MALRTLILRSRLDKLKSDLSVIRGKDADFQKREAELEAAVTEMTEETSEEDRNEVEKQAEEFQKEKDSHEEEKKNLEGQIEKIEGEIEEEEKRQKTFLDNPRKPEKREREGCSDMSVRTKFYGMNIQERDAFFAREDIKNFLGEVRTCIKEKRAISNVGLTIPETMLELLKTKVEQTSKLLSRVTMRPVAGTARQRIMGSIPEAIWTEMCARLNELDLGFNDVEVDGYKVGGFFAVCNAILEDNDVNLMSEILNALGKAIGKALDKAILYGTGIKMPLGIVTRLAQASAPSDYQDTYRKWEDLHTSHVLSGSGKTGIALFQEIVTNTGVIENDYSDQGLVWIMNKKTHTKLKVQAMGTNMNAAIVSGFENTMPVAGGEVIELPFIADDDIIFGYMDMYLMAERAGISLGQSEHVRFIDDQTVFKGTARYDGVPVIAEAFAMMNIASTKPQTSATFMGDTANDATLKSLEVGDAALSPVFNASTFAYTTSTTSASIQVTAEASQKEAWIEVTYNGKKVANGSQVTLASGKKNMVVTVANGAAKMTYTVEINKTA